MINEVSGYLEDGLVKKINHIIDVIASKKDVSSHVSLYAGNTSNILFLTYLRKIRNTSIYDDRIVKLIYDTFDLTNNISINNFGSGTLGFYWLLKHINDKFNLGIVYNLDNLIKLFSSDLKKHIEQENFDFIYGIDGIMFFLIENKTLNEKLLELYLNSLDRLAVQNELECYWLDTGFNKTSELPTVNLGLAHGLSSRIIILSRIIELYPNNTLANKLLSKTVKFLLKHENLKSSSSLFPTSIDFSSNFYPSRLSWCYGDLGVGLALMKASKVLKDAPLYNKSLEIFQHSSKCKSLNSSKVVDTCVCHGSAGIAHIFNRLFFETGRIEFKNASRYWLGKTIEMSITNDENVEIKNWDSQSQKWVTKTGLLEGDVGVALTLMGFITFNKADLDWDKCLLIS